ncbi:hypothetical protein GW17_00060693 [Ensete ventricosum]|nr:hypothetical protein GW17_00060693 [Ensete ventricosum]RZR97435.1 hypothetical protein BHM03_00026619 [Ensete ventricosum]
MAEHDKFSSMFTWNGNQKHDWGLRGRRYDISVTVTHAQISFQLKGSPDSLRLADYLPCLYGIVNANRYRELRSIAKELEALYYYENCPSTD